MPGRIVDTHVHIWNFTQAEYAWLSGDTSILNRNYELSELESGRKAAGVTEGVLVQAANNMEDSRWMLANAAASDWITGVVGWLPLEDPVTVARLLEEGYATNSWFKGVRHLVESEPAEDWLVQPTVLRGLHALAASGVSYDLLVHTRHLKYAKTVAEKCPELRLVIDHMAKPPIRSGETKEWAQELKAVAAYPNVHCKLSGLVTEANLTSWRTEDLRPFVERALEYFGPQRMMFGSDWPVSLLAGSYDQVLESVQLLLARLNETERNGVLGENAMEFYRLHSVAAAVEHQAATAQGSQND